MPNTRLSYVLKKEKKIFKFVFLIKLGDDISTCQIDICYYLSFLMDEWCPFDYDWSSDQWLVISESSLFSRVSRCQFHGGGLDGTSIMGIFPVSCTSMLVLHWGILDESFGCWKFFTQISHALLLEHLRFFIWMLKLWKSILSKKIHFLALKFSEFCFLVCTSAF